VAQSPKLAAFFAPDGELHDVFRDAFPVRFDVHDLEFCSLSVKPNDESGDDFLHGVFRVITWDATRANIRNIWEQELPLLWLAPAVEDDVYRMKGFRLRIRPEVVKARLRSFARGLAGRAAARFPDATSAGDLLPEKVI
jgi:hypothetical protein